jgi:hypothetical protein
MIHRRGWLVAAAHVAAGLFLIPGQALAGCFGRKRCKAVPQCCPSPAEVEPTAYAARITIQNPPNQSPVGVNFPTNGTYQLSYGLPCVLCVIRYPDGSTYPSPPGQANVYPDGTWKYAFTNAPKTLPNQWADLYATLYDPTCTTYLDSDMHQIQIVTGPR